MSFAAGLPDGCPGDWRRAVEHPFVGAVADGSLAPERFHEWIRQDYRFVRGLAVFVRRLLALAPDDDRHGLEAGLAALDPELDLFRDYAAREGIDLAGMPSSECAAYLAFLQEQADRGWAEALCAYYACERAYLEAWSTVREQAGTSGAYGEWVANWTSVPFRAYVDWLGERLDAIAIGLDEDRLGAMREVFAETVRHEVAFWDAVWS